MERHNLLDWIYFLICWFEIGNGALNDKTDQIGMYDFFASHALIVDRTANDIKKYCDFSSNVTVHSSQCLAASKIADSTKQVIDIYNIYYPLCLSDSLTHRPRKASVMNYDPCSDYYTYAYLNQTEVQRAMHANVTNLANDWDPCSDVIKDWSDSASTIIPLLREFMDNGLRVWVCR